MDLFSTDQHAAFLGRYAELLQASGARERFSAEPSFEAAEALTLAMFDAIHETAPEGSAFALMYSGGKDSSAALHYFVESVLVRVAAGKRYVGGLTITSSTQHEFASMAARQEKEIEAINKWGAAYGIRAEIVTPAAKNTVMVELLGNGLALPPRARNDKVAAASIANWCVMRVKSDLLDAAVERAATVAPFVIQVLGSRYDESTSRGYTMNKYSEGMPCGMTRLRTRNEDDVDPRFVGFNAIGHFTGRHVRDFIHNRLPSYRPFGNLELEQIYRDMSTDSADVTECSIQRTADGGFGGGCSNLATGTRSGCFVCLKSTNLALYHLAQKQPKRYSLTHRLQERINRHQDLVHARPKAVKAGGWTPDDFFPKGFTFEERYIMLVILLAAEIEAGERQLSDEQLTWIERRWQRHGIYTVTTAEARKDAQRWIDGGCEGDPVPFFHHFGEMAGEFTTSLGEGMSLGAYAAHADPEQSDLNLAHLLALGITGTPVFPQVLSYVFTDRANPDNLIVAVTDEPAVLGTRTSTGLINGMSGATLRCIGVRQPTQFERMMADGRHIFYKVKRSSVESFAATVAASGEAGLVEIETPVHADFLTPRALTPARLARYKVAAAVSALATIEVAGGIYGGTVEPYETAYLRDTSIVELRGRLTQQDLRSLFGVVSDLVSLSDDLQGNALATQRSLMEDLEARTGGDWGLLSSEDDQGKELRRAIRSRLKTTIFGNEGTRLNYRDYISGLRELAHLFHAGLANTALATRVAYIVRTHAVYPPDAEPLMDELVRLLDVKREAHTHPDMAAA